LAIPLWGTGMGENAANSVVYFLRGLSVGTYLLVLVPTLLRVLIRISFGLRCEGYVIRQQFAPKLQSSLLPQRVYGALGSVGGRIRSPFRALSSGSFGGWRAYSPFSGTATELAFHRDRVARGITSVDAAQREAAYVRLIEDSKGR
jgi:hypothetical protein